MTKSNKKIFLFFSLEEMASSELCINPFNKIIMDNNALKKEEKSGQVYAELLCDFMFKRLFGSEANKDVLIGFLNMLLKDVEIIDVDFIPTEHQGLTEEDRKVIFDIACTCKDGRSFIIEMQKGYQKHFRKRAVYYTTYPINEQGRMARERYIRESADKMPSSYGTTT